MSDNVSYWLHFWNPRPRFTYSLYNFYWATTTIKGRLLSSRLMLKPFSGEKIISLVEMAPKMAGFFWKWESKPYILVSRPPKSTSLRGIASFAVFCVNIGARVSAVAFLKKPPPKKIVESLCAEGCEITHAQNRNPWTDLDKILYDGRYHRRNYPHKFWWPSVKGFWGSVGSNFPLSHWLSSSSLQHYRASVWCGGIFKYTFVANISLSSSWREF